MKYLTIIAVLLLSGCATLEPYARQAIEEKQAYEENKIELGEYLACNTTIPAVIKRYKTKAELERWLSFCWPQYEGMFTQ